MSSSLRTIAACCLAFVPFGATAQQTSQPTATQPAAVGTPWLRFEAVEGGLHYFQYSVRIQADGQGVATLAPRGPGDTGQWSAPFQVSRSQIDGLNRIFDHQGLFTRKWEPTPPMPCGPSGTLQVTRDTRQVTLSPDVIEEQQPFAQAIIVAVRALVPASIEASLNAKRDAYRETLHSRP